MYVYIYIYVIPSSCHSPHVVQNIPFSLAFRIVIICSEELTRDKRSILFIVNMNTNLNKLWHLAFTNMFDIYINIYIYIYIHIYLYICIYIHICLVFCESYSMIHIGLPQELLIHAKDASLDQPMAHTHIFIHLIKLLCVFSAQKYYAEWTSDRLYKWYIIVKIVNYIFDCRCIYIYIYVYI